MRDEPRDDMSEWWGVTMEGGRVTRLEWDEESLSGTIPSEIGALSALRSLRLCDNELSGSIPPTIGALTNLESLGQSDNPLSGIVPFTLSNLKNLRGLRLTNTELTYAPTNYLKSDSVVQDFLYTLWLPQALRFLNHCIAIT